MLVAVGVSVRRAIAVAVISAITVARMSGVGLGVGVTVGVGVKVGSGVGVHVGETARSETSSGSGVGEASGGSQLRHRASARASARGFHSLVVFTQSLVRLSHSELLQSPDGELLEPYRAGIIVYVDAVTEFDVPGRCHRLDIGRA